MNAEQSIKKELKAISVFMGIRIGGIELQSSKSWISGTCVLEIDGNKHFLPKIMYSDNARWVLLNWLTNKVV